MAKNTDYTKVALVLTVMVVAAFYIYPQLQAAGIPGISPTVPDPQAGPAVCPPNMETKLQTKAVESQLNVTTGQEVVVADNAYVDVYKVGVTQYFDRIELSSGFATSTTGSELLCDTSMFYLIAGNDTANTAAGYYLQETAPVLADRASMDFFFGDGAGPGLDKMGSSEIYLSNGTDFHKTAVNLTMAGSASTQDISIKIVEDGGGVFRQPALIFNYSTTYIDDIIVTNAGADCVTPVLPELNSTSEKICFVGIDRLEAYESYTADLLVTSDTDPAGEIGFSVQAIDVGTYVEDGHVKFGFENYNNQDVGADSSSQRYCFLD